MAKVIITLTDENNGLQVKADFDPELDVMHPDQELTEAQKIGLELVSAIAAAADVIQIDDEQFAKTEKAKQQMN